MKNFVKFLLLTLVCLGSPFKSEGCDMFEVSYSCSNKCEPTCDVQAPDCRAVACNPGTSCVCGNGFARNSANVCVPLTVCPPRALVIPNPTPAPPPLETSTTEVALIESLTEPHLICSVNETLQNCANTCDLTCDNSNVVCNKFCEIGEACACKSGYVRISEGVCIDANECPEPHTCDLDHEMSLPCANKCEPTCDNLGPMCSDQCDIGNSCTCEPFFVRGPTGECILASECPNTNVDVDTTDNTEECPTNEFYKDCGGCQPSCDSPNPICTLQCRSGCYCNEGLVRNSSGVCIPLKNCPPKCGANEIYSNCGSACEGTCRDPFGQSGTRACVASCVSGCFCDKGFTRNAKGKCVLIKDCTNEDCQRHEVFKMCGTDCGQCKRACYPGCFCKERHTRNSKGTCDCRGFISCLIEFVFDVIVAVIDLVKQVLNLLA